ATLAVNLMPPGSFDKAALEAMLIGVPLIAVNPAFAPLWGEYTVLLQTPPRAEELASRIAGLLAMAPADRAKIGGALRERTIAAHSLDGLMDRLVALMASIPRRSSAPA
ncbi:MAG TPA: hypothetical protein VMT34_00790, partial [Aggregatilineales bacterium]|nr:hypothetical protein [Aggregatilineales bacterium]